jgi:hypothetical protein
MATNLAVRVMPEPVRSLAFGSISGTYAGIGTPFLNPVHLFIIQNFTDQSVMISWDGINDHFPVASMGYIIMDVTSNKTVTAGSFMIAQGTRFYVKQLSGAPSLGSVYLSVFYGFNG